VFAGFYALMALGLNVVFGLAGMINLGLVGFFAIGAYVSALLTVRLHLPMPAGWAAAAVLSAAAGAFVAVITARLKGDYLAIVTLGFAEVIRLIASNEIWLTNGTDGISAIPGPGRAVLTPLQFNLLFAAIVWIAVGIVAVLLGRISNSPFGRVLRAIREDDMIAAVAGKPVLSFKVQAFALSAGVLGLAGALYGHYNGFIAPDSFLPLVTIYVVLALTAGGTGTMRGAILGAVLVVFLTEGTRFLGDALTGLKPVQTAAVREAMIGAALILVLYLRPQGLVPERTRVLRLDCQRREKWHFSAPTCAPTDLA
jgi:branched-chain amino acid transport system permease protein